MFLILIMDPDLVLPDSIVSFLFYRWTDLGPYYGAPEIHRKKCENSKVNFAIFINTLCCLGKKSGIRIHEDANGSIYTIGTFLFYSSLSLFVPLSVSLYLSVKYHSMLKYTDI